MKLTMHLLRADLRRLRWVSVTWVALVIASAIVDGVRPLLGNPLHIGTPVDTASGLLLFARLILGATSAALIIQTHPLVGTTAFWFTRPIPPGALLRAKVLLAGTLLVIVPALADVVLMLVYAVPSTRIAGVVLDASMTRAAAGIFIVGIAAYTPSLARFAMVCAACVGAVALMINMAIVVSVWRGESGYEYVFTAHSGGSVLTSAGGEPDGTADIVSLVFIVGAGLLLLRAMYHRAALRRTVPAGIAIPVLASIVSFVWPWHVLKADVAPPPWAHESSLQLVGQADSVTLEKQTPFEDGQERWRAARAQVYLTGVPPKILTLTRLRAATLTSDAGALTSRPHGFGATLPQERFAPGPVHQVLLDLLGVSRIGGSGMPRTDKAIVLHVPEDELPDRASFGTYRGDFDVELLGVEVASVLPLRPGAVFKEGALTMVIDAVVYTDPGVAVHARVSNATSSFDRGPRPNYTIFLRHPAKAEAVGADMLVLGYPSYATGVGIGNWSLAAPSEGFWAHAQRIRFQSSVPDAPFPSVFTERPARVDVDESWMREGELVIVRTRPQGTVRRTLEMQGVALQRQ